MKYIIHIGHSKNKINLKPNQKLTGIVKDLVSIFYMLTGMTFILQSQGIINFLRVIIDTMVCIDLILLWVLLFVFVVKEYDTNITE